jgi:hypothetical protein
MRGVARTKLAVLVLSGAALSAPFALMAKAQSALAESAASAAVRTLLSVTAPLSPAAAFASPLDEADTSVTFEAASEPGGIGAGKAKAGGAKRPAAAAKPQALFVSAGSVLSLSRAAVRPRGSFVPQTSEHPAGLRLVGVGALGIGVRDGDILIDAMGIVPRSSGEIIGAVIEARARRERVLSGTLWRSGHTFRITVEQPYLDPA